MHFLWGHFQTFFAQYGLWAVCALLLLENAGLPLPGETALLYGGFLSHQHKLASLPLLIAVGILACTLGDNLGYWIGREASEGLRHFLHLRRGRLARVERYFQKYGVVTVFFARFIAGLRIIAGPAAGLYHMPWEKFVLVNALGAIAWVTTIAEIGYFLGQQWDWLVRVIGKVDLFLLAVAIVVVAYVWRKLLK